MKFGLQDKDYQLLKDLAINKLIKKGATVWVFGSRARGDHKPHSDIDLMFNFPEKNQISQGEIFQIKSSLEDSRLPIKVDLVDVKDLAESYKDTAFKERVIIAL